ncbi:hypothetical protein GOP47_0011060 [Adiantum capillus-veneris]|uniref:Uncharacterized protein n=1 Tax=Adiantum capillus-veneris TaxID=13818 RepID=A0A9D4UT57_ADICA|nr:hypothetical protein GOP47_0011060 [Adiantum capillus-veneris]
MDYHTLSRRQLQSLCKKHGIPANATNLEMADALSALLMPKPDTAKKFVKIATRSQEVAVKTTVGKEKIIPPSETQVQNAFGSDEKSTIKPLRATRSRRCLTEAPASAPSNTENSKNVEVQSALAVQKQGTKSVSTRRKVGSKGEDRLLSKPEEVESTKVESPSSERKIDRAGGIVLRRGRVKFRSPRRSSTAAQSDKSLRSLDVNGEGNEVTQGYTCAQSCLLDAQKIQLRKNKRSVTFSDVLEVTHSISESPSADTLTESRISSKGLAVDQENQILVSTCEDKKAEGSRNNARRASRKDCNQGNPTVQVPQQKSSKVGGVEVSKDINNLPASKQSQGNIIMSEVDTLVSSQVEMTVDKEHFSESRTRRRSICGRKGDNEAGLALNEKDKVGDNHLINKQVPLVPNTRQSRRLTLIASDFNTAQDKGKSLETKEEDKAVDCSVQGNLYITPVSSTRSSRRSTLLASDVNINRVWSKVAESSQEKSDVDGSNFTAPTECDSHVQVSRKGRQRTLPPLESNYMHRNGKSVGEQMMKTTAESKNTNRVKNACDLGTGSHIAPTKNTKAKTDVRIFVSTDPIKPEQVQTSENICCSRQKNSTCPAVQSSNGKKKNSNMQMISDREASGVLKPGAQELVRETESGAALAKSKLNFCETEALEVANKEEEVDAATTADIIQEADEIMSHSNGPEIGGIQYSRPIQQDLNGLNKAAAKSSRQFKDLCVSTKSGSEDSSTSFVQETVNLKGFDSVQFLSTNYSNSTKSSNTLFSATSNKLGPSSAADADASISPCGTGVHGILEEVDVGNTIVTVAQNASSCSEAVISIFSSEIAPESECLEIPKEDHPLFDNTSKCGQQALVDCNQEDCAASKSGPMSDCRASEDSPMSDFRGSISPTLVMISESLGITSPISTRLISDEGIIDYKEAKGGTSPVSVKMGPVEGNLGEIQFTIDNEVHAIATSITSSDIEIGLPSSIRTRLAEVMDTGNQDVSDMEIKNNEVAPQGLPGGSVQSQRNAEEGNNHINESFGSSSPISAITVSDEGVIDNKEAQQRTSVGLTKMSTAEGNVGGSQLTIYDEGCAIETSAKRADIESSSPSLNPKSSVEGTEHGSQYIIDVWMKDSLNIEEEAIVSEGLAVGSLKSPFGRHNSLEAITSEQGSIDSEETLESNSPVLTNMSPADGNLDGHQFTNEIAEHKTESSVGLRPDINSGSGPASSSEDIAQCIKRTTVINSPEIKADNAVKEGLSDSEMKSLSPHQFAAEACALAQEMCSGNELLVSHENECVGSPFGVLGSRLPVEVSCKTKQRWPRAIYKSARKFRPSGLQKSGSFTEMDFGSSEGSAACFMPCNQGEDVEVQGYGTPDVGCDGVHSSSLERCEEGDSEEDSFSDGEFSKFNVDVVPLNADKSASYSEENMSSDSGEDSAFDSKVDCFEEEEEVLSGGESYESEGDTSEEEVLSGGESYESEGDISEELSESDDESLDDSGSLADLESSGALHSVVKLKSSEDSSCIGHFFEAIEVEANAVEKAQSDAQNAAAYGSSLFHEELTLGQRGTCQSSENESNNSDTTQLLSNDHNSLAVVDLQLATHIPCHKDTALTSLSFLFATPTSKIKEVGECSSEPLSIDYQHLNDGVLAENGQQSMVKAESHTAFCASVSALQTEQEENGEVCGVLQRGLEPLCYIDQAVHHGVYQALELTVKADFVNKEVATEDAADESPDNSEEVCSDSLKDLGAGKNYPDTSTTTVDNGDEQAGGVEAASVEFAPIAVAATEDAEAEVTDNSEEVRSNAMSEDIGTSKNYPDTSTGTVEDGVANYEQTDKVFGVGVANVESATVAVDLDLLQDVEDNIDIHKADVVLASPIAPPASLEAVEEETVNTDLEVIELCTTIPCAMVAKSESDLCQQAGRQQESMLCDISHNTDTKLTTEEQGESWEQIFPCEITQCRDSDVVQYAHVHESLVEETQAPQCPQIPQTPCATIEHMRWLVDELLEGVLNETQAAQCPGTPPTQRAYAEGEQMRGPVDELLVNVLNETTHNCLNGLQSKTEAVYCAEIPQTLGAYAKGDLKSEKLDIPLKNVSKDQEISQPQSIPAEGSIRNAPMEELLQTVLNKAQACENPLSHVIKEAAEAENPRMEISREQSLQHMDLTLMSLRKLKQMCKENDLPPTTKPMTETPSRREVNAWMSAKRANTSVQPRDLPSANKRSALKALSSNFKSNTPAASARTPTVKSVQRPRNLMFTYNDSEGAGKNLVAPSPQAPLSSSRHIARQI